MNLAFRPWEGVATLFPSYAAYWIANLAFFSAALFGVERLVDKGRRTR